jgi:hypothetical protein
MQTVLVKEVYLPDARKTKLKKLRTKALDGKLVQKELNSRLVVSIDVDTFRNPLHQSDCWLQVGFHSQLDPIPDYAHSGSTVVCHRRACLAHVTTPLIPSILSKRPPVFLSVRRSGI